MLKAGSESVSRLPNFMVTLADVVVGQRCRQKPGNLRGLERSIGRAPDVPDF